MASPSRKYKPHKNSWGTSYYVSGIPFGCPYSVDENPKGYFQLVGPDQKLRCAGGGNLIKS